MAQEHQEYIQTKVNPTLENLVTQVLLARPEKPVPFMVKWLAEQTQQAKQHLNSLGVGEAERLRNEIRSLQQEVKELEEKLGQASTAKAAGDKDPDEDEDDEDEEDDVTDEVMAPPARYLQAGPRASVSAEAYGDWNKVKEFTPPVHEKNEDQQQRLRNILTKSFMFNALDKANMDVIIGAMLEKTIEAEERIIQEGDDGEVMFVIEEGNFECLKILSGEEKVVKQCSAGDVFGELALLYNCPRAASVISRQRGVVWQLDRETFNHIVKNASMAKRQAHEEFLKSVKVLENLGQYERAQLADALHKETFAPGDFVIKQGEDGSTFYLVEEGELVVLKSSGSGEDPQQVLTYKRGDYFGELALMHDDVRKASVQASTESKLLSVDRKTFKRVLGSLEDVMKSQANDYA